MDWTRKRHDTGPPLIRRLRVEIDGVVRPYPLTGTERVTIYLRRQGTGTQPLITGLCAITDIADAEITYNFGSVDLAISGVYDGEYEIVTSDGVKITVPDGDYFTGEIVDDLNDA